MRGAVGKLRASSTPRKRYCLRGHDTFATGRRFSNGNCIACLKKLPPVPEEDREAYATPYVPNGRAKVAPKVTFSMEQTPMFWLPSQPLREEVLKRLSTWEVTQSCPSPNPSEWSTRGNIMEKPRGAITYLKEKVAERYDMSTRQVEREWRSINRGAYITDLVADRWSIFLGLHPVMLWPQEWSEGLEEETDA